MDAALDIICNNGIATEVAEDRYFDPSGLLLEFCHGKCFLKSKAKEYQPRRLVNIRFAVVSRNVLPNVMFIYPWSGCEKASSTYDHEKTALSKLVEKDHFPLLEICHVFNNTQSSHVEIGEARHN